jgi:hypothetical protein
MCLRALATDLLEQGPSSCQVRLTGAPNKRENSSANVASTPTTSPGRGERGCEYQNDSGQLDHCWIGSSCMHCRVWNLTVLFGKSLGSPRGSTRYPSFQHRVLQILEKPILTMAWKIQKNIWRYPSRWYRKFILVLSLVQYIAQTIIPVGYHETMGRGRFSMAS